MELRLAHGRETINEEMDGQGFDGPRLAHVASMQQMYGETYTVGFITDAAKAEAQRVTGWVTWDNLSLEIPNHHGLIETHEPGKPACYAGKANIITFREFFDEEIANRRPQLCL